MATRLGRSGPHGAPRGLLVYWMLHRISLKPTYGFEILREIEEKTEGAWRPGPGSVYPLLRRMTARGLVESSRVKGDRADQHLYRITKKGADHLGEAREVFRSMGRRWGLLSGIFADMIEPSAVPDFVTSGSRRQFELTRKIVELNRPKISDEAANSMLKEYSLLLDNQKAWVEHEVHETLVARNKRS